MRFSKPICLLLLALAFACNVAANQYSIFGCKKLTVNPLTKRTECFQCEDGYLLKTPVECSENFAQACSKTSGITCNIDNCIEQVQGYLNQVYRFFCRTCPWPYYLQNGECKYFCNYPKVQAYVDSYSDCPNPGYN